MIIMQLERLARANVLILAGKPYFAIFYHIHWAKLPTQHLVNSATTKLPSFQFILNVKIENWTRYLSMRNDS